MKGIKHQEELSKSTLWTSDYTQNFWQINGPAALPSLTNAKEYTKTILIIKISAIMNFNIKIKHSWQPKEKKKSTPNKDGHIHQCPKGIGDLGHSIQDISLKGH